jgi:hypothetical protein
MFPTIEEILDAIRHVWREVTLEWLQSVFFDWIERLEYVIEHDVEYYINDIKRILVSLWDGDIGWGGDIFYTLYLS